MEEIMNKVTEEVLNEIENKDIKQIVIEHKEPRTVEQELALEAIKKVRNPFAMVNAEYVMRDLGLCRNKAYSLLKQEGYITTDGRNGAAVGSGPGRAAAASARRQKLEEELKLIVAEAKVNGISLGELEQMIGKLY